MSLSKPTSPLASSMPKFTMLLAVLITTLAMAAGSSYAAETILLDKNLNDDPNECDLQLDGSCAPHMADIVTDQNAAATSFNQECGLYLAESAIPNSGLGMYTARDIPLNHRIFYGDVAINVEDIEINMKLRNWYLGKFDTKPRDWLLDHYFWNPTNAHAQYEADDVQSIIPGLGMLANSHPGLVNSVNVAPRRVAQAPGVDLHRGKDPGAGASTAFYDAHFISAREPIEAGAELFVAYGDNWFRERQDLGMIPLSNNFEHADDLLDQYHDIVKQSGGDANSPLVKNIYQLMRNAAHSDERLVNALPETVEEAAYASKIGGTAKYSVPNRVRSLEWLQENGSCLDNLRPGISTVRQAGRGAFATRAIPAGSVIAPLPLVQIRRHHMEIYDADDMDDPDTHVYPVGRQLIMNYCYGHPDTSLLLFPYAPVVNYINHNSTTFNAKLAWSTHTSHQADWLQRSPESLDREDHTGLIMDLIATKDIAAGEEVFLNYGDAWEQAWKEHVANWAPAHDEDKSYVSAFELNRDVKIVKTVEEEKNDPYAAVYDAITACFIGDFAEDEDEEETEKTERKPTRKFQWTPEPEMYNDSEFLYRCDVVDRSEPATEDDINSIRYTVRVHKDRRHGRVLVENVPRKAITFFDSDYTSDMFLRDTVFRHEIRIPDEMIPDEWRDLKK